MTVIKHDEVSDSGQSFTITFDKEKADAMAAVCAGYATNELMQKIVASSGKVKDKAVIQLLKEVVTKVHEADFCEDKNCNFHEVKDKFK